VKRLRLLVCSMLVVVVLLLVGPHAWAWYQLRAGRSDLKRYRPEAALVHLRRCLRVWPNNSAAQLLASRAERQSGNLEEADRRLRSCQRLEGSPTEETVLEWALLRAASGDLRDYEQYLQGQAQVSLERARLVWEALAEGYVIVYRILDAIACLDHWLAVDPDNLKALELRGLAYHRGKSAQKGADDLRKVVERDPTRSPTRWRLVLCLLDAASYDEALTHLEKIEQERPGDPEVLVRLARCHNMLDRGKQAREILDGVLESHPDHALGLRTRAQFALTDREPARAESWLRRAAKLWPDDYQTHWLLVQALQQQNKTEQANAMLKKAEEIKDRVERLSDLRSRKMSDQPLEPSLHCEMGVLLIRGGYADLGERWLKSALSLNPEYRPAHAALAEYYQSKGDAQRAEEHRRRAER
jgi:tetratricopeptide (TPR) repeat protein